MKEEIKRLRLYGVAVLVVWLVIHYWDMAIGFLTLLLQAASPIMLGIVMAFVINIPMGALERLIFARSKSRWMQRVKRPLCLTVSLLAVGAMIAFVTVSIIPEVVRGVRFVVQRLPDALQLLTTILRDTFHVDNVFPAYDGTAVQQFANTVTEFVFHGAEGPMNAVISTAGIVFSAATSTIFAVIVSVYLLYGKERLISQAQRLMKAYMSPDHLEKANYFCVTLHRNLRGYLVAQLIQAAILGALCALGMMALGLPHAMMIGALMGVTALIPIAGAFIGAIVGALMILLSSPVQAVIFLIFNLVLQQLEGNLIFPRVVGSSIGLPSLWVLCGVLLGGAAFGLLGMLIAVPLVATMYQLLREDVNRRIGGEPPTLSHSKPN